MLPTMTKSPLSARAWRPPGGVGGGEGGGGEGPATSTIRSEVALADSIPMLILSRSVIVVQSVMPLIVFCAFVASSMVLNKISYWTVKSVNAVRPTVMFITSTRKAPVNSSSRIWANAESPKALSWPNTIIEPPSARA